jgi:hypothetical protein
MLFLGLALGVACVSPGVRQEKARTFEVGLLGPLQDGRTTRQEVLLRLATPSSTFEEGRILIYDYVLDPDGEWRRTGVGRTSDWSYPHPRTSSLVLVFGPDDRLVRHSLVRDPRQPDPAAQDAAAAPPR